MTATVEKSSPRGARRPDGSAPSVAGAPTAPQVNLLPPEVKASRSLQTTKRVLLLAVVGTLALAGVGFVVAQMQLSAAESDLAREQAETQRLLAEQAKYAEVPQVLGQLDRARSAQELGTVSEVMWAPYMRDLMSTAPDGVAFGAISVIGATPMQPAPGPGHPLESPSEYRLTFTGRSLVLPDTAAWIEALESIDGFEDAYVSAADRSVATSGSWADVPSYEVTGSVQVTAEALAQRFAPKEED